MKLWLLGRHQNSRKLGVAAEEMQEVAATMSAVVELRQDRCQAQLR